MRASSGVVDVIVRNRVPMNTIARDAPTPSSAVMRGRPAAMNDANVMSSTKYAMRMPSSSVMLMPVELCENSWPPTETSEPAGSAAWSVAPASCRASTVDGSTEVLPTESWIGTSAADVVGAEVGRPGRVVRRARCRHLWDLLDARDRVLDRGLEVGIGHVAAVGGDGDELGRRPAHLRECTREGIECLLGFRAGNAVGVVGAHAQQGGAREQQGQHDEPRRQHPSTRPERPAAERVERG